MAGGGRQGVCPSAGHLCFISCIHSAIMFDKIIIKAHIDTQDIDTIVLRHYLEQCTTGDEVFYRSTEYSNLSGLWIEVRGGQLTCKCSVCKLWNKGLEGRLDNFRPMTWAMAIRTLDELLLSLCVRKERAWCTYFEVGLTMKVSREPVDYIRLVEEASGRTMWNDANYPVDRQKTTEKSKYIRKVLKMYDKTFEARGKHRPSVVSGVLRIETVYRHQKVPLLELTSPDYLAKLGRTFYQDWSGMQFERELIPEPGVKLSELAKAREIVRLGVRRYKEHYLEQYQAGRLTRKQWETMRSYANRWDTERLRYTDRAGPEEEEFKEFLNRANRTGIFTSVGEICK